MTENSFPEKKLDEFVRRLKEAAGENLQSVVLYGSAVTGEYDAEYSNINLLCLLRDSSFVKLEAISPVVQWWFKEGQRAPLVITNDELTHASDVFVIELMDIRRQHRVLYGPDLVGTLEIPNALLTGNPWSSESRSVGSVMPKRRLKSLVSSESFCDTA